MAYESVKNQIDAYIKANGVNLITGPVLNAVLTTMLDELGEGYAFQGVLNTTDTPSPAADIPQAWLASAGTYLGESITVDEGELALIIHTADGWSKETVYRGVQLSFDAIVSALGYTPADEDDLAEKQDTISDLAAIRSGAAAGATAVQPEALSAKQDTIADLPDIRSGAALGETSVQPADIENMVEAEPIGSIIPPVNPSEFATKEELSQLGQELLGFNADMLVEVEEGVGQNTGSNPAYLTKTLLAGVTYRLHPVGDALLRISPRLRSSSNNDVSATWVNVQTQYESTASEKAMDIGATYDITPLENVSRIGIYYSAGNAVGTGNVVLQIRNPEASLSEKVDEIEGDVEDLAAEIDGVPEEVSVLREQVDFFSDGLVKTVHYDDTVVGLIKTDGTLDESPSTRRTSPYIPFLGDTTIYNAFTGSANSYAQVAFYDENYNYLTYRRGPSNTTEDSVSINKSDYPNASFLRYALPTSQAECKATMPASVIEVVQQFSYSPNYGKSVSLFGASFSAEQRGYYAYAALNKWREKLGFDITNYSVPGAGFTPAASSLIQTQVDTACADGVEATDIYIIWASANDFGGQGEIGVNSDYTIDDRYNPAHLNTFCGGLNYCIKKILTKAPTAKIILLTSLRNGHLDSGRNPYSTGSGNNLAKYVDAEKECCYRYGVPYLDQYAMFPMNEFTKDYYLQEDGRHPNVLCYELLADMQIPFLASI